MPFRSEKQRKFMFAQHPEIAKRWVVEGKGFVENPRKEAMKRRLQKKSSK